MPWTGSSKTWSAWRPACERRGGARLAQGRLGRLLAQARIFGFHLATLDLRQHSERHRAALAEVFQRYGLAQDWAGLPEPLKVERLTAELLSPRPLTPAR